MAQYCFGVDIGGTTVKLGIFHTDGTLLDKWEITTHTENEGKAILPDIAQSVLDKLAERNISKGDVIGVGVGVPAPVTGTGIVKASANIGWGYKDVKGELEALTGIKTSVSNDANVAALGEMWLGGARGCQDLIMVTLGTGVGGGIIADGKIVAGANGASGEIGHINVNMSETNTCGCGGKGCLEQYASATGIARIAKKKLAEGTYSTVLKAETVTAKDVFDAFKVKDEAAIEIVTEAMNYLGYALSNMAFVTDPELIVIGGGVSKAGRVLLECVEQAYKKYAHFTSEKVKFALAELGNDAGICGAAKMVLC